MTTIMVLQITSLAGAKLVVPEPCKYYWQSIPGVKFATARYLRFYFPSNRNFHSPPSFLFVSTNIVQPLTSHKAKTDHSSHHSPTMQVRGIWPGFKEVYANDWMYFTYTVACPTANNIMAVTVADAWSPGAVGYLFNQLLATQYLAIARCAQIPRNSL
jgi:hypothetical protein